MRKPSHLVAVCALVLIGCSQQGPLTDQETESPSQLTGALLNVPDTVTVVESSSALNVAAAVLAENGSRSTGRIPDDVKTVSNEDGIPLYYVVNLLGGGYVVVSATRDYTPIIAYSEDGHFSIPLGEENGVSLWMALQEENIRQASAQPDSVRLAFRQEWSRYNPSSQELPTQGQSRSLEPSQIYDISYAVSEWRNQGYYVYSYENFQATPEYIALTEGERSQMEQWYHFNEVYGFDPSETVFVRIKYNTQTTSTGPLLSTTWGQDMGYNKYVPNYTTSKPYNWPLGCNAVAAGQIMRYHEKPTTYSWSQMPDDTPSDVTAAFLYDVAEACNTSYYQSYAEASVANVKSALKSFGFTSSTSANYTQSQVQSQINNARPVFMRGDDSTYGGHAWVCDGYRLSYSTTEISMMAYVGEYYSMAGSNSMENLWSRTTQGGSSSYFHNNWGWSGSANGWFSTGTFNPTVGSVSYNFNNTLRIIYNIY
ncbi:MAG: C10 family peptidase [Bacteroidales bacterium]|nr:C10 family peptidase [Bacteroidales bacterium]